MWNRSSTASKLALLHSERLQSHKCPCTCSMGRPPMGSNMTPCVPTPPKAERAAALAMRPQKLWEMSGQYFCQGVLPSGENLDPRRPRGWGE